MSSCTYDVPWAGPCGVEAIKGTDPPRCGKHKDETCWCGEPAVRGCSIASSFVCGAPLCDEHECKNVAGGLTGSRGMPHSRKGRRQWEEWKAQQESSNE